MVVKDSHNKTWEKQKMTSIISDIEKSLEKEKLVELIKSIKELEKLIFDLIITYKLKDDGNHPLMKAWSEIHNYIKKETIKDERD
ncbi:MAG: hypothetical protein GY804_02550 [Alphaproteobacteria bacterium]|nr:hypothetical protein [Alphaproteobacteria bacterium]